MRNRFDAAPQVVGCLCLVLMLSLNSLLVSAQDLYLEKRHRFFNVTQFGYNRGIGQFHADGTSLRNSGVVNRLRTTFGMFVTDRLTAGVGAGFEAYHGPSFNMMPVVADVRYYLSFFRGTAFLNPSVGFAPELSANFSACRYSGLSFGYFPRSRKRDRFFISAGAELHRIRDAEFYVFRPTGVEYLRDNVLLKSISFNVGVIF